jgi:ketosteroid isomerase-like protein
MDRAAVQSWIATYEQVWRSPGVGRLAELFTADASYLSSPWGTPIEGLDAIGRFWDAEREGADEQFDLASEVLAVDDGVAVARVEVDYAGGSRWRDLWVMRFDGDGRCTAFEEWPFAPGQSDGH